jgi:hypothetical protein
MSFGMMRTNVGAKGKAQPHYSYIMALGKYANKADEIEYTENGNMPSWAKHNPAELWECADLFERKNGSTYREHVVGLPRELNKEQRLALVKEWITQEVGNKPYSVALHNVIASDGEQQPHIHLMFCERLQDDIERTPQQFFKRYNSKDPSKGGARKDNTGKTPQQRELEDGAEVKFMFANAIIPMLVELERSFTSYEIKQVANLQSRYAMRLYEFLIRFKTTKKLEISLEDLRFRFGLLEHEG